VLELELVEVASLVEGLVLVATAAADAEET
jgi:hypothetical protein